MDDIPFNIKTLTALLENRKYRIDSALTGHEAITKVDNFKSCGNCQCYKVILMDIEMPILNGIDTTIKIKEI